MGINRKIVSDEKDTSVKNIDDLDIVYLEQLKKQGMSDEMIEQFKNLVQIDNKGNQK